MAGDLREMIAARRQAIQDAARCGHCGETLANCKAQQGQDPTAPPWFGCCARGTAMAPCHHVPDPGALLALLAEIEAGEVRTVEEVSPKPAPAREMTWVQYLDQGERWKPNGRPMVRIDGIGLEWRYNASRWLERHAARIATRYSLGEGFEFAAIAASPIGPSDDTADAIADHLDRAADDRARDPLAWIRTTALYRALIADLPNCSIALDAIAERARHWSTCPVRRRPWSTCCNGSGLADYAAVPCPDPACPVPPGPAPECRCAVIAAQCERCRSGDLCGRCGGEGCSGPCAECAPKVPEWTP
jgi:hypothetical protein